MKSKTLLSLMAIMMLIVFTAACLPDNPPPEDTPVVTSTLENPTSAPTALPTELATGQPTAPTPTTAVGTSLPATSTPVAAPSATQPSTANPTPNPTTGPSSNPTLTPTSTLLPTAVHTPTSTATVTSPASTATSTPATPQPGFDVQVVNNINYTDINGDFHVIGEIKNIGTSLLTQIELTLVMKDSSGKSLLTDINNQTVDALRLTQEDQRPGEFMPTNLAPGETSPFSYILYSGSGIPDPASVKVTPSGQSISTATLGNVEIQHAQMVVVQLASGDPNSFLISGMVVNKDSKPVVIRDIAAALIGSDKRILATDISVYFTTYLAPAGDANHLDSTPFYMRLTNPAAQPDPTSPFKIYVDAEEVAQPITVNVKSTISNHYTDSDGAFHIVGTLANSGSDSITTKLVAGLYDRNNAVLDVDAASSQVNVAPGEVIPYDISSFENVNNNAAAALALDHFTVQIDNYYTFTPVTNSVTLPATIDSTTKDADYWTVTGKVTNNSNKVLSLETVLVAIYDASDNLCAVNYTWILPNGDSIDKGSVDNFSVVVSLPSGINTTNFTVKTLVKGELK